MLGTDQETRPDYMFALMLNDIGITEPRTRAAACSWATGLLVANPDVDEQELQHEMACFSAGYQWCLSAFNL